MNDSPYARLAARLDELPNGFPPAPDGSHLRLLTKLFTPDEAALAAQLRLTPETPAEIAARVGGEARALRQRLKSMVTRGLITAGRAPTGGLGYGLLPFVVGIYEMQAGRIDAELAQLFEDYYQPTYRRSLPQQPPLHRVIPVGESVPNTVAVRPFESARDIILNAQAWGVTDCICRVQQNLIGHRCDHPVDVCLIFGDTPGLFDHKANVRALTQSEALDTLQRAAAAGLVHSVSNNQRGLWYLCNCCTCACGFLRGLRELGIANVIARSAFVCVVDEAQCMGCGDCLSRCSFDALSMSDFTVEINVTRCAGCGACVVVCPNAALSLERRPDTETIAPPETEEDWRIVRAASRGLDLSGVR